MLYNTSATGGHGDELKRIEPLNEFCQATITEYLIIKPKIHTWHDISK